jgi:hypothetical protein
MYTIGDISDGDFALGPTRKEWLKDATTHSSVQPTDTEARQRAAKRKVRHIERTSRALLIGPRKREHLGWVDANFYQRRPILREELQGKAIEACADRRVGGEHIACARCPHCFSEADPQAGRQRTGPFQHRERGMAFVDMADHHLRMYRFNKSPAAYPKCDLLHKPHLGTAPVELAGDASVHGRVQ